MTGTDRERIIKDISDFFGEKIRTHGSCPAGVDWKAENQLLGFQQVIKVISEPDLPFSINDVGCGYGAFVEFLNDKGFICDYTGYDVSMDMIESAKHLWENTGRKNMSVKFIHGDENLIQPADYSVATGIFNKKQDVENGTWLKFVLVVIDKMNEKSKKGIAFNMLTTYSDPPLMRNDLYYADPCFMFDYCKRNFSGNVALLHDYGIYEFTIIVRKDLKNNL